jgi:hypothetical protein
LALHVDGEHAPHTSAGELGRALGGEAEPLRADDLECNLLEPAAAGLGVTTAG